MIVIEELEQGSEEWLEARLGIPTASMFSKVITPTGKPSSQSEAYRCQLIAEYLTGQPTAFKVTDAMERGNLLEPAARSAYEFITELDVKEVGLTYLDERRLIAASPDGLCPDVLGGLEIKCPEAHTHVLNLLSNKMPTKYIPQVQGNIWIHNADHWDFMSYHESMEPLIVRVNRDDDYIKKMSALFDEFIDLMLEGREKLTQKRIAA